MGNITKNYSPTEKFAVSDMSMKCRRVLPQNNSQRTFLSETSFLYVFMRRYGKHHSKAQKIAVFVTATTALLKMQ